MGNGPSTCCTKFGDDSNQIMDEWESCKFTCEDAVTRVDLSNDEFTDISITISHEEAKIMTVGSFRVDSSFAGLFGEGRQCVIRRGTKPCEEEAPPVAVRLYKHKRRVFGFNMSFDIGKSQFEREVWLFSYVHSPVVEPGDKRLWHEELRKAPERSLFVRMLDHSKDDFDRPGADSEGSMYTVLECGRGCLRDYLQYHRRTSQEIPHEVIREAAQQILLCAANLHAKGLVHTEMKPENFMIFDGRFKLIGLHGCVMLTEHVRQPIAVSPCYASPQWASLLVADWMDNHTKVKSELQVPEDVDVWGAALTICELVTLVPLLLSGVYAESADCVESVEEGGLMCLEALVNWDPVEAIEDIKSYSVDVADLVRRATAGDVEKRWTAAECLGHAFFSNDGATKAAAESHLRAYRNGEIESLPFWNTDFKHGRTPLISGRLLKLEDGADPEDDGNWVLHDVNLTGVGKLHALNSYNGKRKVLARPSMLFHAKVLEAATCSKRILLSIHFDKSERSTANPHAASVLTFAFRSRRELLAWCNVLCGLDRLATSSVRLGAGDASM
eukprot:TRINITY_DN90390_c0_g1_i1.p1 TRINITY_DN90390_c0_g1~~TRINITY_DN90390_c0_g1_i1.p1  ORF type:complete len:557 (-),score=70.33 TRINITY_DN90390_c0_g1_i1:174-1844(-)